MLAEDLVVKQDYCMLWLQLLHLRLTPVYVVHSKVHQRYGFFHYLKRYRKIRCFERQPFAGKVSCVYLLPVDEGPSFEASKFPIRFQVNLVKKSTLC